MHSDTVIYTVYTAAIIDKTWNIAILLVNTLK